MVFICVLHVLFFFPLDGQFVFLNLVHHCICIYMFISWFLSGLSIHLSGLARPCEPVRSWMNWAFLETTLGQSEFANASCCETMILSLCFTAWVVIWFSQMLLGCVWINHRPIQIDRCLIDVTMEYCCPSFLALSIRWLKTPTEQAE